MTQLQSIFNDINVQEEDFGDGIYVTSDLLKSYGRSLQYLKDATETLDDATDPNLRKRFAPPLIDPYKSFGVVLDVDKYKFDSSATGGFTEDFNVDGLDPHLGNVDKRLTTAYIDTVGHFVSLKGNEPAEVLNTSHLGPWATHTANQYWYIGFNKAKNYSIPAAAKKDPFGTTFDSVCRAQTFTTTAAGYLSRVILRIDKHSTPEDHLYLELRTTSGGAPTNTVLARAKVDKSKLSALGSVAFQFTNHPPLANSTKYALVLRSPFTSYAKHYGIAGWGAACYHTTTTKYSNGDSYTSSDNGHTWVKHGKDDATLPYGEGSYAPEDFLFEVYTIPRGTVYDNTKTYYYYSMPARMNPIKTARVLVSEEKPANTTITYAVSNDKTNWHTVTPNNWYTFSDQTKQYIWVRAALSTTVTGSTPKVNSLILETTNDPAQTAYIRTLFHEPKLTAPLGARIWSEINAPATVEANCTLAIDIVRNNPHTHKVHLSGSDTVVVLPEYAANPVIDVILYKDSGTPNVVGYLEYIDYTFNYTTKTLTFNSAPPAGMIEIKYYPLLIRGLTVSDFPFRMDFIEETFTAPGGTPNFQLKMSPLDPLRRVYKNDVEMFEGTDYTVDYPTGLVTFGSNPALNDEIVVKYTPDIPDTGLGIAYRMSRTNTTNQIYVKPNWFQYRV